MMTSLKRIIKLGIKGFFRNTALSIASVFIIALVVFLITMLFLFNIASKKLITDIREKVDITVYFKEEVSGEEILQVKDKLFQIPEVKDIEYVSKEEALDSFVEKHKDDSVLLESLEEVGGNPFLASLNIKAHQADQYEQISNFLANSPFKDMFAKVDYYQRKPVIEKLFSVTSTLNKGGILISIIFGIIAILVAFNTVKIAIFNSSEEISTMRLVGASNWFIQGPFLIQGFIAGVLAAVITLVLTLGLTWGLDSKIKVLVPEISALYLFLQNFGLLLLIQIGLGVGVGMLSSFMAIRKYLRV